MMSVRCVSFWVKFLTMRSRTKGRRVIVFVVVVVVGVVGDVVASVGVASAVGDEGGAWGVDCCCRVVAVDICCCVVVVGLLRVG